MDINVLREYYKKDAVYITQHAAEQCRLRGIISIDIRSAVDNGEVIEDYPTAFPFPCCLILGTDRNGKSLHVCMSDEGSASRIITAYYPDPDRWSADFRVRREHIK